MPKKSKSTKSRKSRSEKGDVPIANYRELVAEDPDFYLGTSKFEFPNGDSYEGEFCAHSHGLVWRQGKGKYTTNDGQIYEGEWDGDKLMDTDDIKISYADGSNYHGSFRESKYCGAGIYKLEEKVSITCHFQDNKPTGDITLIDPNGGVWHGFAEENNSLLIPEHPFYSSIGKDQGKGRFKHKFLHAQEASKLSNVPATKTTPSETSYKYGDLRDIELELFAKSRKTPSDFQLESSEWYQDYVKYVRVYGDIIQKVNTKGEISLTHAEYDWYKKYKEFARKYLAILNEHKTKEKKGKPPGEQDKLFSLIHSEEYKMENRPMPVFYSREKSEEVEEEEENAM